MTSPFQRALLHYAVRRKQAELRRGIIRNDSLWDKLVFNRIQVRLKNAGGYIYISMESVLLTGLRSNMMINFSINSTARLLVRSLYIFFLNNKKILICHVKMNGVRIRFEAVSEFHLAISSL